MIRRFCCFGQSGPGGGVGGCGGAAAVYRGDDDPKGQSWISALYQMYLDVCGLPGKWNKVV